MTGALLIAKLPSYCPAKMSYQQALQALVGAWRQKHLRVAGLTGDWVLLTGALLIVEMA